MLEKQVIKLLTDNNNYKNYRNYINIDNDLSKESQLVVKSIDDWFASNTESLSIPDLSNLVFSSGVSEKSKDYYQEFFNNLGDSSQANDLTGQKLLESFKRTNLLQRISTKAYEASRGYADFSDVQALTEQLSAPTKQVDDIEFVTDDIHSLIKNVRAPGLRWRLRTLNNMMGSLRRGDFGFLFARPETGKTTFLASEMTFMAGQITEEKGPILWFNNEEVGEKVQLRCYQAALDADLIRILASPDKAARAYTKATNNKLRIYDAAMITKRRVEEICAKMNPSLIVFDQIDKITGFKADREDMVLGAIYQWARELAKTYCPVIGVCQASGDAEGVQWLNMSHVASAKTSKQGEADWILGIGRNLSPGHENIRYLHLCKNKLSGDEDTDPNQRHGYRETLIKPQVARYEDI